MLFPVIRLFSAGHHGEHLLPDVRVGNLHDLAVEVQDVGVVVEVEVVLVAVVAGVQEHGVSDGVHNVAARLVPVDSFPLSDDLEGLARGNEGDLVFSGLIGVGRRRNSVVGTHS